MIKKFQLYMPTFNENRQIHMYLPDDYLSGSQRYPVLYMFDGHNLFLDSDATYGTSWKFIENIENHGFPMIVVGQECSHQGNERLNEYGPYPFHSDDTNFEGKGVQTMEFFVHTLKPYIDQHYPTLPDRDHTWIGGSSCGGLMAYYAGICYNEVYSKLVCVSPYFIPTAQYLLKDTEKASLCENTYFYMSWGSQEAGCHMFEQETKICTELTNILIDKGAHVLTNVRVNGRHCEEDWSKELPRIFAYLKRHEP